MIILRQKEFGNKANKIANKKAMAKIIAGTKLDKEGHTGESLLFNDIQYMMGSKRAGNNKDILPNIPHGSMMRIVRGNDLSTGAYKDKIGKFFNPSKRRSIPETPETVDQAITKRGALLKLKDPYSYKKKTTRGWFYDTSHRNPKGDHKTWAER